MARKAVRISSSAGSGRTVGYARVSSEMQVSEGQSLQVQESQLHGWAQMAGRQLDRIVVEPGVSAGIEFIKRPEGSKLWADLRQGDTLVAARMDRLFRNTRDCLNTIELMKQRGISFRLLDLGGGMDELTSNGLSQFFLQVMAAVAELEKLKLSERIAATKARQKAAGEYSGGRPPFGWTRDENRRLVEVPEQQKAIAQMKRLRTKGLTVRAIAAKIAEGGVSVSHAAVHKTLRALGVD